MKRILRPCRIGVATIAPYAGRAIASVPRNSYGYAVKPGRLQLREGPNAGTSFSLARDTWFSTPFACTLHGGEGMIVHDHRADRVPLFQLGGPAEPTGRFAYMDGITDTTVLLPVQDEHPCLNWMHIPARCAQTKHHHPDDRLGIVVSGRGQCVTSAGAMPLRGGDAFAILKEEKHYFETHDDALVAVTWHPSARGPTDSRHPLQDGTIF